MQHRFLTTWLLEAARQDVWDALADVRSWPQWWEGALAAEELEPGDARRVGSRHRVRWRGIVPYSVAFEFTVDAVREPAFMSGRATGDVEGTGTWRLFEDDGVTAATYDWSVRTTRRRVNALGPVARPLLARNHDHVMRRGGEGLARRLGARLLAAG